MEAWFAGVAYHTHRHDTYAICLTTDGAQAFGYRGAGELSLPGQVVVLHPDEPHDGRAATPAGFGYRIIYVEPALISRRPRRCAAGQARCCLCARPRSSKPTLGRRARRCVCRRAPPTRSRSIAWCCNWPRG